MLRHPTYWLDHSTLYFVNYLSFLSLCVAGKQLRNYRSKDGVQFYYLLSLAVLYFLKLSFLLLYMKTIHQIIELQTEALKGYREI